MKNTIVQYAFSYLLILVLFACQQKNDVPLTPKIADGQMPNIAIDNAGNVHLVYGSGDSVLYAVSNDGGSTFSAPVLVNVLPGLYSFATRGPQIAVTNSGVTITACDKQGNIFSYQKSDNSAWIKTGRVNDVDSIAKEGLMALGGDGNTLFAAWLDLRNNSRNNIEGALSTDGGKTWQPNILVYASPDSSVCECCKPSAIVKGNNVYVMFRNWLNGNRDLYVATSPDGGKHFNVPEKAGLGNWALNGCPMDGGGLAVNTSQQVQTVWRRHDSIFASMPGKAETTLGKGKGCSVASAGDKNVYAWSDDGTIVCQLPDGTKQQLGKGELPIVKTVGNTIVCVWENNKQVQRAVIKI